MSRPVLIGVEIIQVTDKDGATRMVPDIGAGVREHFQRTGPDMFTATWGEHALTVARVGRVGGKIWFIGSGSRRILQGLAHLGASVKLVADLTPAQRDAIIAKGFKPIRRVGDGALMGILPPVVFAGQSPISVGLDGEYEDGEDYEVIT